MAPKPIPLFSDFLSMKRQIQTSTGFLSQQHRWQRLTFITGLPILICTRISPYERVPLT